MLNTQIFCYNSDMNLPPALIVFLMSMLPVGELRAAIPVGLFLGMPAEAAFFWAELGNMIPIFFILKLLGPTSTWLMKHSVFFNKLLTKLFHSTREKHSKKFERIGSLMIVLLEAIPLPGTGGWTGAVIAFLFDVPYWKAIGLIFIGNVIAGILVTAGVGGAMEFIKLFSHGG